VRDPVLDAVAEALGDGGDVLLERVDGRAPRPAARVVSQWKSVTYGAIPFASSSSTSRS
jgi:hypothetical protein